ncbi:VOC family protein [Candidatus Enterococcus ikei]|uniref:VOC family protein n=1 Tax=Candidatus Enterococcus ikei TaxID=2815326 RepID=A0ABS3GXC3_9ENTE|nr:VOC family protein [Enterococcus sp. DIV0869a]MBO0439538.1 VOC family protein [Enterococcus sp. DIV0869a]
MEKFQLSEDVYVKTIALRVKNVDSMVSFYKNVLGFILKLEENNLSLFGSQKKDSRLLILEETDSQEGQMSFFEKAVCFSLLIPTKEEFGSILRRITSHNYPIDRAIKQGKRKSVFLKDPEGNELEVCYQEGAEDQSMKAIERLDIDALVRQSKVLYSSLSADVRFDRIKLSVRDKAEHYRFYQRILGMTSKGKTTDQLLMNEGNFSIHLDDWVKESSKKATEEEALGLDFFVLTIGHKKEMEKLKQHLEEQKQEFFVDKKLTILTIYDPSKIEWWFVRN